MGKLKRYPPSVLRSIKSDAERLLCERSLIQFLRYSWRHIDPHPYKDGWHLHAIAEHLEAVSRGEIRRLLINIPPRHCKTLLSSVVWPAWLWTQRDDDEVRNEYPLMGAGTKFLCLSYAQDLALDSARLMRKLVASEWYQSNWGDRVRLTADQDAKHNFVNLAGGMRLSGGIDGTVTGRGGDIKILDDPHKVKEVESEVVRQGVINTYDETLRNRVTDPKTSAEVVVMQRIGEDDLSGHILAEESGDTVHLMLPAEYDSQRHCVTYVGGAPFWEDPRRHEGDILWPEQWGEDELAPYRRNKYQWAGQYQQSPSPRGGGIFKTDWWKLYPKQGEEFDAVTGRPARPLQFPPMEYVVASLDTAFTTKKENAYSACTVWGSWLDDEAVRISNERIVGPGVGVPKIMLMDAWQEHLEFHDLVQKVIKTCRDRHVDRLLIEAKANGINVCQEIIRLCGAEQFGVTLVDPGSSDKVARAYAVQHMWEAGLVYAPERKWSQIVIDQMATFPKGKFMDLVDTATQAAKHLREVGIARHREEYEADMASRLTHREPRRAVYDV